MNVYDYTALGVCSACTRPPGSTPQTIMCYGCFVVSARVACVHCMHSGLPACVEPTVGVTVINELLGLLAIVMVTVWPIGLTLLASTPIVSSVGHATGGPSWWGHGAWVQDHM